MARRTTKAEAIATDATETPVEVTETPATKSPKKGTSKKEKVVSDDTATPEVEIDLTQFNAAVDSAIEGADESTGIPTPEAVEEVNAKYREVEGVKGKNAAKAALEDGMKVALNEGNLVKARAFMSLKGLLSAATTRAP